MYAQKSVLTILAHPDDSELTCYGTLLKLAHDGYCVHVLELTRGQNSTSTTCDQRVRESRLSAELGNFHLHVEDLDDGEIQYDIGLVSLIEHHINIIKPSIVITHFPQTLGRGHQDHEAVGAATINAARRTGSVEWILCAEPPTQSWDFQPQLFVDITDCFPMKTRAIRLHASEANKPYMCIEASRIRAQWWAFQAYANEQSTQRMCEAFVLVKGLLNRGCPF